MIKAHELTKYFGRQKVLDQVSFEIGKGEIVGFLGSNGAGKTTLMRILTSFLPASSGDVSINGFDVAKKSLAVRQIVGYLPENPPLYLSMTVKDYLKFAAKLKDVAAKQCSAQVEKVMSECRLKDVEHKVIATLSKGYKQRVGIAQAIINDPSLLILDEPTSGLDPVQNLQVRNLIKNLESERTVILSTHILSEIEQVAKRVMIIKEGKVLVDERLSDLLTKSSAQKRMVLRVKGEKKCVETVLEKINDVCLLNTVSSSQEHHFDLELADEKLIHELLSCLVNEPVQILEMSPAVSRLEHTFVSMVNENND